MGSHPCAPEGPEDDRKTELRARIVRSEAEAGFTLIELRADSLDLVLTGLPFPRRSPR